LKTKLIEFLRIQITFSSIWWFIWFNRSLQSSIELQSRWIDYSWSYDS